MPTIVTASPLPDATQNGPYSTTLNADKSNLDLALDESGNGIPAGGSLDIGTISTGVPTGITINIDCANCDDDLESILAAIRAGSVNCTVDVPTPAPTSIEGGSLGSFGVEITPIDDGPFTAKFQVTSDSDITPTYNFDLTGVAEPAFVFGDVFQFLPDTIHPDQTSDEQDAWNDTFVGNYDETVLFGEHETLWDNVSTTPAPDIDPDTTPPSVVEGGSATFNPVLLEAGELPGTWSIVWDLGEPSFIDSFNASTGELQYSPQPGDAGGSPYGFTLQYEDDVGRQDTQAFSITVTVP